jgi:hypothetical protein
VLRAQAATESQASFAWSRTIARYTAAEVSVASASKTISRALPSSAAVALVMEVLLMSGLRVARAEACERPS